MNIVFIVDGSPQIGMGHIMRSMALADTFKYNGHQVYFFSKYKEGIQVLKLNGFDVIKVPYVKKESDGFFYGSKQDLSLTITFIQSCLYLKTSIDVLVVDSYVVSEEYFCALKQLTKCLVYIDDLNAFIYPVDVLVNGTSSGEKITYTKANEKEVLLLGLNYNMLRKEFCGVSIRRAKNKVENVLLTTGGSDPYHMTEKFLEFLSELPEFDGINFHIIKGKGFSNDIDIHKNVINNANVILYEQPESMSKIMLLCDLAITAGGSTVYELAACGVPMITFCYADNQIEHINVLEDKLLIKNLGSYCQIYKEGFKEAFLSLINDYDLRRWQTKKLQKLVNGKGTQNIVDSIENYLKVINVR